jgi:hypothetical protein
MGAVGLLVLVTGQEDLVPRLRRCGHCPCAAQKNKAHGRRDAVNFVARRRRSGGRGVNRAA